MDLSWRVVFRGLVAAHVLDALSTDRMLYVSGHGGNGAQSSTIWVRAPDAATAEQAVRYAITGFGEVLAATRLPYLVSIGVPDEDAGALGAALSARLRATGSVGGLITEPEDGFAEVMLDIVADNDQETIDRGLEEYSALRSEAGLAPADPAYVDPQPPWPRHQALFQHATHLRERREHELAVVVVQTAFEVLVAQVIAARLRERNIGGLGTYITNQFRTYSLTSDATQRIWNELTNDTITQVDVWAAYRAHVQHRNAVVHDGTYVNDSVASQSLEVVQRMIEHVEGLPVTERSPS